MQVIKGEFLAVNRFQIQKSFLSSWPLVNIYRAELDTHEPSVQDEIISCEDIECHCVLFSQNGLKLLTKLYSFNF